MSLSTFLCPQAPGLAALGWYMSSRSRGMDRVFFGVCRLAFLSAPHSCRPACFPEGSGKPRFSCEAFRSIFALRADPTREASRRPSSSQGLLLLAPHLAFPWFQKKLCPLPGGLRARPLLLTLLLCHRI